ncbi:MAG TPA: S24 family peptidase [Hyphomicrobiales bacterium]|nr:S24 family peptidase [Hyphomicrobiales bacterium]
MARPNRDPIHLAALQDYYAEHRLIPSYAAISALLGFQAKTAAAALVRRLEQAGYLRRTPDRRITPTPRFFERPRSVGAVRAGLPEAITDSAADMVSLDTLLVHKPSLTFFMPIKGDSMIDVGLLEGDTAICERRQRARVGDIVVAWIGGEATIKTLAREQGRYVLTPENQAKAYPVLRPDPLELLAVVTGSFRSYRQ